MLETYRGIVAQSQIDHVGHMNVQWYTAKFDESTWHLFASLGLTAAHFRAHNTAMVAVKQTTEYKAEALAGDLLVTRSKVLAVQDKSITFVHTMCNASTEAELAVTEFTGVHLDCATRKACSLPAFVNQHYQQSL